MMSVQMQAAWDMFQALLKDSEEANKGKTIEWKTVVIHDELGSFFLLRDAYLFKFPPGTYTLGTGEEFNWNDYVYVVTEHHGEMIFARDDCLVIDEF